MAVSVRLSEMEQAMLDALSLGRDKSDSLREGLRLLWNLEGRAALSALAILNPEKAAELLNLIESYFFNAPPQSADLGWLHSIRPLVDQWTKEKANDPS